nr:hypothetical protein [Methylonatrum kenyense]
MKTITQVVYGLQAASFLIGISFLVAVIINYVKRDEVRGTWLESHFRWQVRTFWFALLWFVIGFLTTVIGIGFLILLATTIWIIYRIVRGWLRLLDGQTMDF